MANPRIMLVAPRSGSGKTLITCALLQALKQRGLKVQAFKCGPDYIDPMFHKRVLDVPSRNLDLFFTGEDVTRALFLKDNDSDVSVIEGVMGLYDGLSGTSEEFFMSYFHDKSEGYAIEIENLVVFEKLLTDSDIKAPQSYKYIDYDL